MGTAVSTEKKWAQDRYPDYAEMDSSTGETVDGKFREDVLLGWIGVGTYVDDEETHPVRVWVGNEETQAEEVAYLTADAAEKLVEELTAAIERARAASIR